MDVKNKNPKPKGQCFFEGFNQEVPKAQTYSEPVSQENETVIGNEYSELLDNNIIKYVKKKLIDTDKENSLTKEQLESILDAEKIGKNRRGITKWITYSLKIGKLAGEYFLDYQDKMSVLKSSLQKYIRRSMTDKALQTGKHLFSIGRSQAISRLKIIIVEEAYSVVNTLNYFTEDMDMKTFLGIVKKASDGWKDKSCCTITDKVVGIEPKLKTLIPDIEWIKTNLMDKSKTLDLSMQLIKLAEEDKWYEIEDILGRSKISDELISRFKAGTFMKDDSYLLIIAILKYVQESEELDDTPLPEIDEESIPMLKLGDVDWFCLDFHTPVGRRALWLYLYKNKGISEDKIKNLWFVGESGLCMGKVKGEWHPDQKYLEHQWKEYRPRVKEAVEYIMAKYELSNYDY